MNEGKEMLDKDLVLLLVYIHMWHKEDVNTASYVLMAYLENNDMNHLMERSKFLYSALVNYSNFLGLKEPDPSEAFTELFDSDFFEGVYQELKKKNGDAPSA